MGSPRVPRTTHGFDASVWDLFDWVVGVMLVSLGAQLIGPVIWAVLLGVRIREFCLGIGPVLLEGFLGGVRLRYRLLPLAAQVQVNPIEGDHVEGWGRRELADVPFAGLLVYPLFPLAFMLGPSAWVRGVEATLSAAWFGVRSSVEVPLAPLSAGKLFWYRLFEIDSLLAVVLEVAPLFAWMALYNALLFVGYQFVQRGWQPGPLWKMFWGLSVLLAIPWGVSWLFSFVCAAWSFLASGGSG